MITHELLRMYRKSAWKSRKLLQSLSGVQWKGMQKPDAGTGGEGNRGYRDPEL